MTGRLVAHYEIEDRLGHGGMGVVYRARDRKLGRRVAIKFCGETVADAAAKHNLEAEARAASTLNHPNIAQVYDCGETPEGEPYLVMEYVPGELLQEKAAPLEDALRIVRACAEALEEAHRHGVIHRDIKPQNIKLNERGEPKILDFGLAKVLRAPGALDETATAQSMTGSVKGTPHYMAPEQARGLEVDGRTDLFSLGALFYVLLTGQRPFPGDSVFTVLSKVIEQTPALPSSVDPRIPPEVDRICMRLLEKNPAHRYAAASALLADLRALYAGESLSIPSLRTRLRWWSGAHRRQAVAGGAAAALALAAGIWWFAQLAPHVMPPQAQRWFDDGVAALRDGSYLRASKALTEAVRLDPAAPLAQARLAEAWLELDYPDRARDAMLRAMPPGTNLNRWPKQDALVIEAIHYATLGDDAKAVERYQELAKLVDGPAPRAQAALDLGRAEERRDQTRAAIAAYQEAVKHDAMSAPAWLRLGALQARQRNYADALKSLAQASDLYQKASNLEGVAEAGYVEGTLYSRQGRLDPSMIALEKTLDAARVSGNRPLHIRALLAVSGVQVKQSKYEDAHRSAAVAVELARQSGLENLAARALIDLGNAFQVKGEIAQAKRYYGDALEAAERGKVPRNRARALINLGGVRVQYGDEAERRQGLQDLEGALAFYRQGQFARETFQALLLTGRARRSNGELAESQKAFEELLKVARASNDQREMALAEEGLAHTLLARERFRDAAAHFAAARGLYGDLKMPAGAALTALNRGVALWSMGRSAEASALLEEARTTAAQAKLPGVLVNVLSWRARLSAAEGRGAEALAALDEASRLADAGDLEFRVFARMLRALVKRDGAECASAVTGARDLGNQTLLAQVRLECAALAANGGEWAEAAQKEFARTGQKGLEWRAWLRLARTGEGRVAAERARDALAAFEQQLGMEDAEAYGRRADIAQEKKLLTAALGGENTR